MNSILNFNVGVLGHVDSGKTSLSKALSTVASTACFDKNPQSKERGITLDLGFSSFTAPSPESLKGQTDYDQVQYTLVDCPGHASLMKTIIGGAAIVDLFMLVIDVTKGIQTQTAECLILGEILCSKMLVVLNKVDLIPTEKRDVVVTKMTKKISKTLESTRFKGSEVVAIAANPGGEPNEANGGQREGMGINGLVETLGRLTYIPSRLSCGPFVFAVDHCFPLKGKGVILTGTCLQGSLAVGDNLEIPTLKEVRKVKSIQMFKVPVERIKQGDRAGMCVTGFESGRLERGVACTPGSMPLTFAVIVNANKVSHFKSDVKTGSKMHISIGHETQVGKLSFFGQTDDDSLGDEFDWSKDYVYLEKMVDASASESESTEGAVAATKRCWALVEFDHPACILANSLVVGSKLDADIHQNSCRIAFSGRSRAMLQDKDYTINDLPKLKIFKSKLKEGLVERISDPYTVIAKGLFRKESKIDAFVGLYVTLLPHREPGVIEGSFGQSGKFKIRIPQGISEETKKSLGETTKKKGKKEEDIGDNCDKGEKQSIKVTLAFKKYVYGNKKKIIQ